MWQRRPKQLRFETKLAPDDPHVTNPFAPIDDGRGATGTLAIALVAVGAGAFAVWQGLVQLFF